MAEENSNIKENSKNDLVLNGFIYLSSSQRKLHEKRQKYEWKIVFTVLTFYILTVSVLYTKDVQVNANRNCLMIFLVCLVFFCLIVISIKFLRTLHFANAKNKQIAEYSDNNINKLINDKSLIFKELDDIIPNPRLWAFYWQISTIITVAIIASGLIVLRLM